MRCAGQTFCSRSLMRAQGAIDCSGRVERGQGYSQRFGITKAKAADGQFADLEGRRRGDWENVCGDGGLSWE